MSAHGHIAFVATADEIAEATGFGLGDATIEVDAEGREAIYPFMDMGFFLVLRCADNAWSADIGYRHVQSGERLTTPFYVCGLRGSAVAAGLLYQMQSVSNNLFNGSTVPDMLAEMDRVVKMPPPPDDEDGGIVFVQPETIAATIEILEDALAATEADLWRDDERGGEGHHHKAHLACFRLQQDLCRAVESGDAGTAQRIVAQFEEVDA